MSKKYRIPLTNEERKQIPPKEDVWTVLNTEASFSLDALMPVVEIIADGLESNDSSICGDSRKVAMALWSVYLQIETVRDMIEDIAVAVGSESLRAERMIRDLQTENQQLRDAPMATDRAA